MILFYQIEPDTITTALGINHPVMEDRKETQRLGRFAQLQLLRYASDARAHRNARKLKPVDAPVQSEKPTNTSPHAMQILYSKMRE